MICTSESDHHIVLNDEDGQKRYSILNVSTIHMTYFSGTTVTLILSFVVNSVNVKIECI